MGCFSYICQECEKPILSDSFRGQKVKLFLLKQGKVVEKMEGEYDSYGTVFDKNFKSLAWKMDWVDAVDLHFNGNDGDGFAAVHSSCWRGVVPIVISDDDPNQGWGSEEDEDDEY